MSRDGASFCAIFSGNPGYFIVACPNDNQMNGMKNIERTGVDIRVALASKARQLAVSNSQFSEPQAIEAPGPEDLGAHGRIRSAFKANARRLVRSVYRFFKPIARPIAFRTRAYLTAPIRQALDEQLRTLTQSHEQTQKSLMQLITDQQAQLKEVKALHRSALDNGIRLSRLESQVGRVEGYAYASARRVSVACGPTEVLVRTAVGYVLCAATDAALISSLLETGELESGTRLLIQRIIKPGDTFIDVGANVGMHTLAAAIAMRGRGRIIAFEPFPTTHDLLRKSIWINGHADIVETHQAAVSNREGAQSLFLGATSGHHSLFQLNEANVPTAPPVEVPLVRLDTVLDADISIDLIKIDVEGAELDVLESAKSIILKSPNIALIVEFGFSHLQRTGHLTAAWLKPFEDMGLCFRAIDATSGATLDWSMQDLEKVPSVNLLFARPESTVWAHARSRS